MSVHGKAIYFAMVLESSMVVGVGESKEGSQLRASLVTRFFLMLLERIQGHGKQQQESESFIKAKAHT